MRAVVNKPPNLGTSNILGARQQEAIRTAATIRRNMLTAFILNVRADETVTDVRLALGQLDYILRMVGTRPIWDHPDAVTLAALIAVRRLSNSIQYHCNDAKKEFATKSLHHPEGLHLSSFYTMEFLIYQQQIYKPTASLLLSLLPVSLLRAAYEASALPLKTYPVGTWDNSYYQTVHHELYQCLYTLRDVKY